MQYRLTILILLVAIASGCADAIPMKSPQQSMSINVRVADQAADNAQTHAVEARKELARSQELLEKAEKLVLRAEAAQSDCQDLVKRIPKPKKKIRRRKRKPKVKAAPVEPKPEPAKPKVPEHSPSDAPLK